MKRRTAVLEYEERERIIAFMNFMNTYGIYICIFEIFIQRKLHSSFRAQNSSEIKLAK